MGVLVDRSPKILADRAAIYCSSMASSVASIVQSRGTACPYSSDRRLSRPSGSLRHGRVEIRGLRWISSLIDEFFFFFPGGVSLGSALTVEPRVFLRLLI